MRLYPWDIFYPAGIYMFKVINRNTRTRCETCPKLTNLAPCTSVSIVNFEQVNAGWVNMTLVYRYDTLFLIIFLEVLINVLRLSHYM